MRIILAGSRSFGAAVYDRLRADHDIVRVWSPSPTLDSPMDPLTFKAIERDCWTAMRSPESVADEEADLFVAAHSHDFISRAAREATRLGGIGYHPSLLPRHRGRDAVRWTVHMRDPVAGGSVYWLTDNVDGGPIAWQDWCFVPHVNRYHTGDDEEGCVSELWREKLFPMGLRAIEETLHSIEEGYIIEIPQEEEHATWEPSWERPPIFRPDLTQIGPGINGFTHITTKR